MYRDQMAHEYALELLKQNNQPRTITDITGIAFDLADAMIQEAKRRTETGFPLDEENKQ